MNTNRDYIVAVDCKNGSVVAKRPIRFFNTDKNTSNIFIKLVIPIYVDNDLVEYAELENASNYTVILHVKKPNGNLRTMTATLLEEGLFLVNLSEDYINVNGDCTCEFRIHTIVNELEEIITSDSFKYTVNKSIVTGLEVDVDEQLDIIQGLIDRMDALEVKVENGTGSGNIDLSSYAPINSPDFTGDIAMGRKLNTTIGKNSVAIGDNVTASGGYSVAFGQMSVASGMYSFAEGGGTLASAYHSHAEGNGSKATRQGSHAEGSGTTSSGMGSHSEGRGTTASGISSHAEGEDTTASGNCSHSEGYYTIASSDFQHVQGRGNIEDTENKYAHIVGNGKSTPAGGITKRSNAHTLDWNGNAWYQGTVSCDGTPINDNDLITKKYFEENKGSGSSDIDLSAYAPINSPNFTTAISMGRIGSVGNNSVALGEEVTASGKYSHAEGWGTTANGYGAHAEGCDTTANGNSAHAEGNSTQVFGDFSHAEGCDTTVTVSGLSSHAEGSKTEVSGSCSHAEGFFTIASGNFQHVQGRCNIEDTENRYAHIVGNGTYDGSYLETRSNAHTLDWNGNAWYQGDLYVGGTSQDDGNKVLSTADIYFDTNGNLCVTIGGVTKKFKPI